METGDGRPQTADRRLQAADRKRQIPHGENSNPSQEVLYGVSRLALHGGVSPTLPPRVAGESFLKFIK